MYKVWLSCLFSCVSTYIKYSFSLHRKYPPGYFIQNLQMDFFNYAGIHRPVKLYVTPTVFLLDVTLETSFEDSIGILNFTSSIAALDNDKWDNKDTSMLYEVYDADGEKKSSKRMNILFI